MPRKKHICPFCKSRYRNQQGLEKHLDQYTGKWRIPADGIHDVFKIKHLSAMERYYSESPPYICLYCAKMIISSQEEFETHVFYCKYHGDSMKLELLSPAFDLEREKIWKEKNPTFPFLDLPFDLREMIYKFALCYKSISFAWEFREYESPVVDGVWLQHNPEKNPLSLLAVNRQVYHEARQVFYHHNTFIFNHKQALPFFLIGIGKENARFLRSVYWDKDHHWPEYENCLENIKPFITSTKPQTPQSKEVNIWNDEDKFMSLLQVTPTPTLEPCAWDSWKLQLLRRFDADNVSDQDSRHHFTCCIYYRYHDQGEDVYPYSCGKAAYELCARYVKDDNPAARRIET